jgi:peptidoglycan-associated lipoprotein
MNVSLSRLFCISLLAITMAACSTVGKKGAGIHQEGAYASGLGTEEGFGGGSRHGSNTHAPSNQTYYFDFDRSDIHGEDLPSIDAQGNYLATHPGARVLLTGNTDERGSREYNIALGERRALSVSSRLMMDGAKRSQIRVVSYGAEKPIAFGHTEADYAKNRRVELIYEDLGK